MSIEIVNAIISLAGTLIGTFGGIMVSMKLVLYRIERLEDAVKENSKLVDRVYKLEEHNHIQDSTLQHLSEQQRRLIDDMRSVRRCGENRGN